MKSAERPATSDELVVFDRDLLAERDWWLNRLAGSPRGAAPRPDFPRADPGVRRTESIAAPIEQPTAERLVELAGGSPFLLYTALATALGTCLSKHTGDRRVAVLSPTPRDAVSRAAVTNAVVVESSFDPRWSFEELLVRVRETLVEAYTRQRYPLRRLLHDLAEDGSADGSPRFGVLLALTDLHGSPPEVDQDLTLTFSLRPPTVDGSIAYDPQLYQRATVVRFAAHLAKTLRWCVENRTVAIAELDVLETDERRRVLVDWNTADGERSDEPVLRTLERRAAHAPETVVVRGPEGDALTHGELDRRAGQLVGQLRALGVGTGARVGILLRRSLERHVATLAVLKVGAAYVPIDPESPGHRVSLLHGHAGCIALISEQGLVDDAVELGSPIVDLSSPTVWSGEPAPASGPAALLDQEACVVYAPDSSGEPKGVMITHRRLADCLPSAGLDWTTTTALGPPRDGGAATLMTDVGPVRLGRPFGNTTHYVLDADLQPVPLGAAGELYVGGTALPHGYLNRPDLTAERFIPDAFGAAGGRLHRCGDRVRYREDGTIEHLGRVDDQVTVQGYRVEPGEVATVLCRHDAVAEAAVIAVDEGRDTRLHAYLRPSGLPPTLGELTRHMASRLPKYMLPSSYVVVDTLPLASNGRVDRGALPLPRPAESDSKRPHTPGEATLVEIWKRVLGVEEVTVDDDFFQLGGDSILSMEVVFHARERGLGLTAEQIFTFRTIAELAAVAEGQPETPPERQPVADGALPLTAIQRWFFDQERPEPHHYNQAMLLALHAQPDPSQLEEALLSVVARHEGLRARFVRRPDGWVQQMADAPQSSVLGLVDLSAVPRDEQGAALDERATRCHESLDLGQGPLVRALLVDLGGPVADPSDRYRLLLVAHHLVVDSVSWRILLEDLEAALARRQPRARSPFPRRWLEQVEAHAQSDLLRAELAYWTAESRRRPRELPVDFSGANTEGSTDVVSAALTTEQTRALLEDAGRAYNTTVLDVLLAALGQVLSAWTGAPDVLVDVEGHGRRGIADDVDISRTVGWFTALYPALLHVDAVDAPGHALTQVKAQLRQVPRNGVGYGLLRHVCRDPAVAKALRAMPSAALSLNYMGRLGHAGQRAEGDVAFSLVPGPVGRTRSALAQRTHLVELDALVAGGRLEARWTYSRNLHRRETIERQSTRFVERLIAIVDHCVSAQTSGYTPADFPLAGLEQADLDRVLDQIAAHGSEA